MFDELNTEGYMPEQLVQMNEELNYTPQHGGFPHFPAMPLFFKSFLGSP